jgi:predicted nucleotidyltransferase
LKLLNSNNVEYLIVGGYAVAYFGYPRSTGDLDIWVPNDLSNSQKLVSALKDFGFNVPALSKELFVKKEQVIRMGNPPIRIEILTSVSGIEFQECFQNKVEDYFDGIKVKIISLENLKKNKKAASRYKDLNDLENLP